ncbi:MAG: bifunctional acetate--CoA ligase family protein/GNAT family N-acetyltransferase [bacterium]|nr:bifunctional acetate--CoA ligase family protein/GNAT family N-acetyltransferase [bacterium]
MSSTSIYGMASSVAPTENRDLNAILAPNNIAVIGATEKEGSVGRTIMKNLMTNTFGGTIFPVNPKRPNVLGIKSYPTISDVPEKVDLAIIVTPAPSVPAIVKECVNLGIPGAIIISAGFKEVGESGLALEREILETARGKMRIIGPNCLGVMMPHRNLNATFAGAMARPGNVAFISQSGAICTAVLDWSFNENVGFSAFISIGSMLDVNWGDLIYYLGDDPHTQSIVIYMESIGNARAFLSAAKEVAYSKPIIVIKAGRTEAAAHAAASHTGSLTGSDEVLDVAFRRVGVLRVDRISDVFYTAEVFAKQPRPKGRRLTIVTNAGGPGVLATDALIMGEGELADISPATMEELNSFLPSAWSHNNPIDILGDAEPARYARALEVAAKDPATDGMLVILTPQDMTDPTRTAEELKQYNDLEGKPVLASWMGGANVRAGVEILNRANIPTFDYPDTAVRLFNYMWRYNYNLASIYETPVLPVDADNETPDRALVEQIIQKARADRRTILTEDESKKVLGAYGLPVVPQEIGTTEDEAVAIAETFGYPVVVKIHSETITHKTDVGGVILNLRDANAVREAYRRIQANVAEKAKPEDFLGVSVQPMVKLDGYELIIGSSLDPQFGPVLLFGSGGTLVEVFKDSALGLPPLTTTLARRMMERTKIYEALKGVRGRPPVDIAALEKILVRFSQVVVEQPWIKEMDLNPLLASHERLLALDARVVLHDPDTPEDQLPRTAIRPYPTQYITPWTSMDGSGFQIRPIRPEDEPLMVKFHEGLSERTVYMRYFSEMQLQQRVSHERLARVCFIDYDREMILVGERRHPDSGQSEILGTIRIARLPGRNEVEFGLLISDQYQGYGLGKELLLRAIDYARTEKFDSIVGYILPENERMLNLVREQGFELEHNQSGYVRATLRL